MIFTIESIQKIADEVFPTPAKVTGVFDASKIHGGFDGLVYVVLWNGYLHTPKLYFRDLLDHELNHEEFVRASMLRIVEPKKVSPKTYAQQLTVLISEGKIVAVTIDSTPKEIETLPENNELPEEELLI